MTSVGNPHGVADIPQISSIGEPKLENRVFSLNIHESMTVNELVDFAKNDPVNVFTPENNDQKSFCCIGNNLFFLSWLCKNQYEGKIACIYTDPTFGTGQTFVSSVDVASYSDELSGSQYLEFQMRRIRLMHKLLKNNGIFYLHIDETMLYHLKLLLDDVFGKKGFLGMITRRKCSSKNTTAKGVGDIADYVLIYVKGERSTAVLDRIVYPWTEKQIKVEFPKSESDSEGNERKYKLVPVTASGKRNGATGGYWRGKLPPEGKHWNPSPEKLDQLDKNGRIYWSSNNNPRKKVYLDESMGKRASNIVMEFRDAYNQNSISCGYPTEKNSDFVKMLIQSASQEGDFVLDPYSGSGTTMVASLQINRRFIGIDMGLDAWRHYFRRLTKGEVLLKEVNSFPFLTMNDIPELEVRLLEKSIQIYSNSEEINNLEKLIGKFTELAN